MIDLELPDNISKNYSDFIIKKRFDFIKTSSKKATVKLSYAYELDNNFKKAYLSLKKHETLKNNLKTSESLIAPNENRLKSDFESIKQEIEEKSKSFREINFQLAE